MRFKEAKVFLVRFGKHSGKTIDQIASSDDGLRYLDWLRDQDWVRPDLREALESYFADPAIQMDLAEVLGDGGE